MNKLLTYALNVDKQLVNINSVANGLECNCICPGCGEKLIAKNGGNIREHHFAHQYEGECTSGYETMKHLLAKEIICSKAIVPNVKGGYLSVLKIGKEITLKELNITPDIFAYIGGTVYGNIPVEIPYIVEIYVTHKVDDNKQEIIKRANIPAIEIDLSKVDLTTIDEFTKEIYNPKNWKIINGKIPSFRLPSNLLSLGNLFYSNNYVNSYKSKSNRYKHYNNYRNRGRKF